MIEEYKKFIENIIEEVKQYEIKYNINSEDLINGIYDKNINVEFIDGSRWAILYLSVVKPYMEYLNSH